MPNPFVGAGAPLDRDGLQSALDSLDVRAAQLWSVIQVETSGCGFDSERRPVILFERHVFSRLTDRQFDRDYPGISNPQPGGYSADEYERLNMALPLARDAALKSASWGIGQLMGFNSQLIGYDGVEDMVSDFCASEASQVLAMAKFIKASNLAGALRSNDWSRFASSYNGPDYRINNYDTRLAAQFAALDRGTLPDLDIREGQLLLSYRHFDTRGIDGIMGKFTRAAMNAFQQQNGLMITDTFDAATLSSLRQR